MPGSWANMLMRPPMANREVYSNRGNLPISPPISKLHFKNSSLYLLGANSYSWLGPSFLLSSLFF